MKIPVIVLAFFSVTAGYVSGPFLRFIETSLPAAAESNGAISERLSQAIAAIVFFIGFYLAYRMYLGTRERVTELAVTPSGRALHRFWFAGWGFDWLYERVFVRPVVWFAHFDQSDFVDAIYTGIGLLAKVCYWALSLTENGQLRWYAAAIAGGAVVYVAIALLAP